MTRDNPFGAGNQQGSLQHPSKRVRDDPSETTRRAPRTAVLKAYLLGALHDGTFNALHKTFRFSQKGTPWLKKLQEFLRILGHRSWLYREGSERTVYALETTASFLDLQCNPLLLETTAERIAYVRGYFDAEGGIPHARNDRLYIQLCQKNHQSLERVRSILRTCGIHCGVMHNPSKAVDPDYWRFYVLTRSHRDFIRLISSWHPKKRPRLLARMMI